MRNLLIFLLVLWGIWWVRRVVRRAGEARGQDAGQGKPGRKVEHMLECAHCGLHVPEAEGVRDGERFFCSEAHRLAGPRQRD